MEGVDGLNPSFWRGRRVFLTGHTGFKGAWLCLWLADMGATVTGYALQPPTQTNLFETAGISSRIHSILGDVRDAEHLLASMRQARPEIVLHMAAQALVREAYHSPIATYAVNVMGTVNLLEAVRLCDSVRAVVNVTTDKCYENQEWIWPYRETDSLGGSDPYSSSKACSELVSAAYRSSFFPKRMYETHGVALATVRAGNVIGGGDWAAERLVPDCLRALLAHDPITLRNPGAIRPWQYVLDPLRGYLALAEKLVQVGPEFGEAWNFGPPESGCCSVETLVRELCRIWGSAVQVDVKEDRRWSEAELLRLDASKARLHLDWKPVYTLEDSLEKIVTWTKAWQSGANMASMCMTQLCEYKKAAGLV